MRIGVPKEIKNNEFRLGLVPSSVRELVANGHEVVVQHDAGLGIGIDDASFIQVGAKIVDSAAEVFQLADMIVKVKEPLPEEYPLLREGQILYTYLHLAADERLTKSLMERKIVGIEAGLVKIEQRVDEERVVVEEPVDRRIAVAMTAQQHAARRVPQAGLRRDALATIEQRRLTLDLVLDGVAHVLEREGVDEPPQPLVRSPHADGPALVLEIDRGHRIHGALVVVGEDQRRVGRVDAHVVHQLLRILVHIHRRNEVSHRQRLPLTLRHSKIVKDRIQTVL